MNLKRTLELIETAPDGFTISGYVDALEWGDTTQYDNYYKKKKYREKLTGYISRLRKQGYIHQIGDRWYVSKTLTPEVPKGRPYRLYITYGGESRLLSDVCKERGVSYSRTRMRIYTGWDIESALSTPSIKPGGTRKNI